LIKVAPESKYFVLSKRFESLCFDVWKPDIDALMKNHDYQVIRKLLKYDVDYNFKYDMCDDVVKRDDAVTLNLFLENPRMNSFFEHNINSLILISVIYGKINILKILLNDDRTKDDFDKRASMEYEKSLICTLLNIPYTSIELLRTIVYNPKFKTTIKKIYFVDYKFIEIYEVLVDKHDIKFSPDCVQTFINNSSKKYSRENITFYN